MYLVINVVMRMYDTTTNLRKRVTYKVADISFVERNVAKMLFGAPPSSSFGEALGFLEASYELRPSKKAALFAGLCQQKLGDRAGARAWMERCVALEGAGESDAELDRQARAALK